MVYGGTIKPGYLGDRPLDIVSAFQSYGEFFTHKIDEAERHGIIRNACPGAGACGGMYTANTMASAIEAMGLSLPYSSSTPAMDGQKLEECREAGKAMRKLLEKDIKPRDIMTREAFENAIVLIMALGGSTNAVLHLIAMARAARVTLGIDDFQATSDRIPFIADLKPSGRYVMEDLHKVGGTPAVLKYLLEAGLLHGDCLTVTGKTLAENLASAPGLTPGQEVIHTLQDPMKDCGHIRILKGNLAPGGAVAKITGKEGLRFAGPARVFDSEETMLKALEEGIIVKGDVIVIRYQGPKGGPGMPEMLTPTSAIMGADLGEHVALLTDGRFSGGSHGFIIGHIVPEAQEGGPIGAAARRRHGHHRCHDPLAVGRSRRRRSGGTCPRLGNATVQGGSRNLVQVHQERKGCLRGLRHRRVRQSNGHNRTHRAIRRRIVIVHRAPLAHLFLNRD